MKNIPSVRIFKETLSTVFIEWILLFSFLLFLSNCNELSFLSTAIFLRAQNCLIPLQRLTRRPCNGIDKSVDMCILGVWWYRLVCLRVWSRSSCSYKCQYFLLVKICYLFCGILYYIYINVNVFCIRTFWMTYYYLTTVYQWSKTLQLL